MRKSYRFRLHEFAADHFSFVQYPNIRRARVQKPPSTLKRVSAGAALLLIGPPALALVYVMTVVVAHAFS
jgi:hypothetical protein